MDKKEIVKKLYEKGILPPAGELDALSEERIAALLRDTKKKREEKIPANNQGISVSTRAHNKSKRISTQDLTEYYNTKYEKLRQILMKKMDAISITNAKTDPSPCGIIGIVKGMTPAGFIFEDPTGELEAVKSGIGELGRVKLDDVFGMRGIVREGRFFPKEIVWPDIPLNHRIGRIRGMGAILSKGAQPAEPNHIVISEEKTNGIRIKQSPEWIYISRGEERVTILAFKPKNTTKEEAISYLKKRSLPEPSPVKTRENPYLIEEIPDILWLIQDEEWHETHKGVTIVSCGGSSLVRIDLENRSVSFEKTAPAAKSQAP